MLRYSLLASWLPHKIKQKLSYNNYVFTLEVKGTFGTFYILVGITYIGIKEKVSEIAGIVINVLASPPGKLKLRSAAQFHTMVSSQSN